MLTRVHYSRQNKSVQYLDDSPFLEYEKDGVKAENTPIGQALVRFALV